MCKQCNHVQSESFTVSCIETKDGPHLAPQTVTTDNQGGHSTKPLPAPIREQHSGHVTRTSQSESSILVTWLALPNQRAAFWSTPINQYKVTNVAKSRYLRSSSRIVCRYSFVLFWPQVYHLQIRLLQAVPSEMISLCFVDDSAAELKLTMTFSRIY